MALPVAPKPTLPSLLDVFHDNIEETAADHEVRIAAVEAGESGDVQSVNGQAPTAGNVVVTATSTPSSAVGGIAATNVQAALAELDTDKATTASVSTVAGDLTTHAADTTAVHGIADTSLLLDTADIGLTVQHHVASTAVAYSGATITMAASDATWNNLPSIGTAAVAAAVGDRILVSAAWLWNAEAINVAADICTEVSGAVVTSVATGAAAPNDAATTSQGLPELFARSGEGPGVSCNRIYVVQSGDINAGTVTFRLRYRNTASSATQKTIAGGTFPPHLTVINLGT